MQRRVYSQICKSKRIFIKYENLANYSKDTISEINKQFLIEESNDIVIQVNGKKRSIITVDKNINEKDLIKKIKTNKLIDKYLKDGEIIKTIYVNGRLINFIIK